MEALRNRPLFTRVYESPDSFTPEKGSAYIYGLFEERSEHIKAWSKVSTDIRTVKITDQGRTFIKTDLAGQNTFSLRNRSEIESFYAALSCKKIYVDMTGLGHHVWAPLIRVALEKKLDLKVVYVEPKSYTHSRTPRKGEIFDLSEKIDGIAPIPLFTSLAEPSDSMVCFIPLLGFEGTRLRYLIDQVEPHGQKIVPVIGVPGFQLEYPFNAYLGNQPVLEETQVWKNTRYARANCPFSLFYVLEDILRDYPADILKLRQSVQSRMH